MNLQELFIRLLATTGVSKRSVQFKTRALGGMVDLCKISEFYGLGSPAWFIDDYLARVKPILAMNDLNGQYREIAFNLRLKLDYVLKEFVKHVN